MTRPLVRLVKQLRADCPWDRRQTLRSMRNNLIEEAYELVTAIESGQTDDIVEEAGDFLFLGFFIAQLLADERKVSLDRLVRTTVAKYRRQHPHVFGKRSMRTAEEVLDYWQRRKRDAFAGIAPSLPALFAARLIQERAARFGFDWPDEKGPRRKVAEEVRELARARGPRYRREELGDLLFACVNLARHLRIDPEEALRGANRKFVTRFRRVLRQLQREGKSPERARLADMDRIWNQLKR